MAVQKTEGKATPRLFGVLVTYRRPEELSMSLQAIASQTHQLSGLVVIDNEPSHQSASIVGAFRKRIASLCYLPSGRNLDAAGGRSLGTRVIISSASADDWLIFFDDDDPLPTDSITAGLATFASLMKAQDADVGGVGLRGARMSQRTGRLLPAHPSKEGVAKVDYLHGGYFPMYGVGALMAAGSFQPELAWGREELELGLRLSRRGFSLYAATELYDSVRDLVDHRHTETRPRLSLAAPSLKRYYNLRNHLYILRTHGLHLQAVGWAAIGIVKPALSIPINLKRASMHLRLNMAAIRDAWAGRLGPRTWRDGRVTAPSGGR